MASVTNLTVADGQVAAAAAEILAGDSDATRYDLVFSNTGTATETLVLTVTRGSSGTARRVRRAVLAAGESLVVTGLALNKADSLKAATTTAAAVDYVAAKSAAGAAFGSAVHDADGLPKSAPVLIDQVAMILA